tara:strand:- start:156 stop:659 length:504 start_codon:yes stop_codon:yes gene_type:complete
MDKKYKYLCLAVLGFCLGFYSGKAHSYELNMDVHCLAQNIYFEAGNQSLAGKIAVANVTMNRVEHDKFPNDICAVVYQTKSWRTSWTGKQVPQLGMCQFSWFCDGKSDKPKDSKTWAESLVIANDVIENKYFDITEGAMWYHADYIFPYWAQHLNQTIHLDAHIFYR